MRVHSSSCCFPRELVSFICPREFIVSFNPRHVTRSPPIGKRIWVERYNKLSKKVAKLICGSETARQSFLSTCKVLYIMENNTRCKLTEGLSGRLVVIIMKIMRLLQIKWSQLRVYSWLVYAAVVIDPLHFARDVIKKQAHFKFPSYGVAWRYTMNVFVEKYILISGFLAINFRSIKKSAYFNVCLISSDNQRPT